MNFDIRKLNVGDFLWVAREKVAPVPGNEDTQEDTRNRKTFDSTLPCDGLFI